MLTSLHIENFALIDRLSIDFFDGFSTITGETGAGKSILLGALGLALGKRADLSALRNPDKKCIIEAHFAVADYNLEGVFEEAGLDYDDQTIIRREILPGGKSRAFVNDSPANLQALADLSSQLIDIHSQHETRSLSESEFQFRILDAVGGHTALVSRYSDALTRFKCAIRDRDALCVQQESLEKQRDYNAFLLSELNQADLDQADQAALESESAMLGNMSGIMEHMEHARSLAETEQFGFVQSMREFRAILNKLEPFSPQYADLSNRANEAIIEIEDIVTELSRQAAGLAVDPGRLEIVDAKLQALYNLQKKHNASAVEELILVRDRLATEAETHAGLEDKISELNATIDSFRSELVELASQITKSRSKSLPLITEKVESILHLLGMPHARFAVMLTASEDFLSNGKDHIEFMFAANKGSGLAPMRKVASGGEMSRIMLAIKAILSGYARLPSIIFDEIDTGVSGEIADAMGNIMVRMSGAMQVFAITHLPQIAAKGQRHYKVFKHVAGGTTQSGIQLLEGDDRIREIAQMLSGSKISDSAINHARALLD